MIAKQLIIITFNNNEFVCFYQEELIKKFIESGNVEEAINTIKDMKPPRRLVMFFLLKLFNNFHF